MAEIVVTDEMRLAVARERCTRCGHDFEMVVTTAGDPSSVICATCGKSWKIQKA